MLGFFCHCRVLCLLASFMPSFMPSKMPIAEKFVLVFKIAEKFVRVFLGEKYSWY